MAIKLITISPYETGETKDWIFEKAEEEIGFLNMLKDSPNVVNILNSEVKDSSVAIVLELCTTSLEKWMMQAFSRPEPVVTNHPSLSTFVPFLSSTIKQLRSKEIVHFDLYPGNILLCGNVWKVTDFDKAEIVPRRGRLPVSPRGAYGFTDPSILESGGIATSKTDLYSVGAILYTLLERGDRVDLARRPWTFAHMVMMRGPMGKFIEKLVKKKFKKISNFYHEAERIFPNPT